MCIHTEENDTTRYGWVCSRCDTAWSPYTEYCNICNNDGEDEEACAQHNEEQQDRILNNDRIFEHLKGN